MQRSLINFTSTTLNFTKDLSSKYLLTILTGATLPLHAIWALPLAVISFSLNIPLNKIKSQQSKKETTERNKYLPRIDHLSENQSHYYIQEIEPGKFIISEMFDEQCFESHEEAACFLSAIGYEEVVEMKNDRVLWIKRNY